MGKIFAATMICLTILGIFGLFIGNIAGCEQMLGNIPIPVEGGLNIDLTACWDNIDCCWELAKDNLHLVPVTNASGVELADEDVNFATFSMWVAREASGFGG